MESPLQYVTILNFPIFRILLINFPVLVVKSFNESLKLTMTGLRFSAARIPANKGSTMPKKGGLKSPSKRGSKPTLQWWCNGYISWQLIKGKTSFIYTPLCVLKHSHLGNPELAMVIFRQAMFDYPKIKSHFQLVRWWWKVNKITGHLSWIISLGATTGEKQRESRLKQTKSQLIGVHT